MKIDTTQGTRLKELREDLGLTQKEIADQLGYNQSYYSQIERGDKGMTSKLTTKLFVLFGVSSDWLLNGIGNKPSVVLGVNSGGKVVATDKNINQANMVNITENQTVEGILPSELIKSKIDSIDKYMRYKFPNYSETDKVYEEYRDLIGRIDYLFSLHYTIGSIFTHFSVEQKLKKGVSVELIVNELVKERNQYENMVDVVKKMCNDLKCHIQELSKYDTEGVLLLSRYDLLGLLGEDALETFKEYKESKGKSKPEIKETNNQ